MILKSKTLILSFILIIFLILVFFNQNFFYFKTKKVFHHLPGYLKSTFLLTINKKTFQNIDNDYNIPFLPETQLINFDYSVKDMSFDEKLFDYRRLYTYYLEIFKDYIIITTRQGKFYKANIQSIFEKKNKIKKIEFKTNIKFDDIHDILISDSDLFVSATRNIDNCKKLIIYQSKIEMNSNNLEFKIFKEFDECANSIGAGRMQPLTFKTKKGILISTGGSGLGKDKAVDYAQDDNSIFGKTIFIDFENNDHIVYSKGHRNVQGLFVKDNNVFATEHGPRGGDEFNKIIFGKNYGWPISSYGEPYDVEKPKYKRSHSKYGFQEPIFSFTPAIGISELYLIPSDFDENWENSILVTSLNGKKINRLQFQSDEYKDIVYVEPIYIGQRIRDIKYLKNKKTFLLALETYGELGVLVKKD
ncbi:PQQ-dependent sugar dehydrogenase [Candidatus Pelagibacter sp.]|uniref:PQQ-dependent sugar dehydrogenase n=1 Tax=Candidatus Pelagibacter sp. TaxID=2024849 RepID=UPI003F85D4A1